MNYRETLVNIISEYIRNPDSITDETLQSSFITASLDTNALRLIAISEPGQLCAYLLSLSEVCPSKADYLLHLTYVGYHKRNGNSSAISQTLINRGFEHIVNKIQKNIDETLYKTCSAENEDVLISCPE